MARRNRTTLLGWKALFWVYLILLFVFVVVKFDGSVAGLLERMRSYQEIRASEPGYNLNLEPFASIRVQLEHLPSSWAVKNLAGNILAFVPFGFLLPRAHRHFRHFLVVMLLALAMICAIEVFQYVTLLGSCDVDDVILNLAGVLIGYLAFLPFRRR